MKALKMTVMIGQDRRVVIHVPESIREGSAEVILLTSEDHESGTMTATGLEAHIRHLLANSRNRTRTELDREVADIAIEIMP